MRFRMSDQSFNQGLQYSFVDKNEDSVAYKSRVLTNDRKRDLKVLSAIQFELRHCKSFYWSVAFATSGGVQSILAELCALEVREIGRAHV